MITSIKKKLGDGEPVLGMFVGFDSPNLVEMIGYAGFDFVVLDTEHGPMDAMACEGLIRGAESVNMASVIRVAANERPFILRALDVGASGVQIPMVNTKLEAQKAVGLSKYYPDGKRGLAYSTRGAHYGVDIPANYLQKSNENSLCVVQMETEEAYASLDEIIKVEGVDVVFIGPTDLSQSLGYYGDINHPELLKVIEDAIKRIVTGGKEAGIFVGNLEGAEKWVNLGAKYITFGSAGFLGKALKTCAQDFKKLYLYDN